MNRLILLLSCGLCIANFSFASIIRVPTDSSSIQEAINGASEGDTVLVAPGTYEEHINFLGKAIRVASEAGAASTIIDRAIYGVPIVKFENDEDSTSILDGFTIKNATATGIRIDSSSPIVRNCTIKNNNASSITELQGGGITIRNGSEFPKIVKNTIFSNMSKNGGGVFVHNSDAMVDSNIIYSNSTSLHYGGGISSSGGSLILRCNTIFDNSSNSRGGAIELYYISNSDIRNNIAYGNTASEFGGAIYMQGVSNTSIINNSFVNNQATSQAGGITIHDCSNIEIKNNIIAHNNYYGIFGSVFNTGITIRYNCLFNNELGPFSGVTPQIGNIYNDPLFLDLENDDYFLTLYSPCIDMGDPSSPYDPDGTRADIGALYFDQSYGINDFHLIEPLNTSITTNTPEQFVWQFTADNDSGFTVYYTHYLDTELTFDSPDSSEELTDTTYSPADTLNRSTQYFWRVQANNYHATPIYSDETWSFYVDGYPSMPMVINPENGAFIDTNTYLTWLISSDPDSFDIVSYTVQIDEDSLFGSPEIDHSNLSPGLLLDDAFAVKLGELADVDNLIADTEYFWRVRSDDNYGLASPWPDSLQWFIFRHQNHPPEPPGAGFFPSGGEETISLFPTIIWDNAIDEDPDDHAGNLAYGFYLYEDTSTGGYEFNDTTGQSINQITLPDTITDNAHFYYMVQTIDDEGLVSNWSTLQDFWTNHHNYPPEPFPLYTPPSDLRWVNYYAYFNWGHTVDYDPQSSFDYALQLSPDSTFSWFVSLIYDIEDTSITMATDTLALAGQDLYWRILAIDDDSLIAVGGLPDPEVRRLTIVPPGDANGDGLVIGSDITYLVGYFRNINPPPSPLLSGDANSDCLLIGSDVTFMVQYFRGSDNIPARGDCEGAE
ncbi:MAG: hypothetical protein GY839_20565 [candidate division Zixibacteria bacterium]|nr:hypothetical protein [candidate division Zixibacteria bacterium]